MLWAALLGCAPDPPSGAVGIVATGCGLAPADGSGMTVAPGVILTSAHVVAGATDIVVHRPGHDAMTATVVGFDPEMDLAYLSVEQPSGARLPVASAHVEAGDRGVTWVYRDGRVVEVPVRVRRRVQIRTEDIYVEGETERPGFELDAAIEAGDSGAAVVIDGELAGVIWARSRRFEDRAYAIDPVRAGTLIRSQLGSGDLGSVDVARCH